MRVVGENMADDGDIIGIGSTVFCKNCFGEEITGEVIAFERQTKFLVLSILDCGFVMLFVLRRFRLACRLHVKFEYFHISLCLEKCQRSLFF